MTRFTGHRWIDIDRRNDLHFVYAFIFAFEGKVHIKIGESTRPFLRLGEIITGCPFEISLAVFCHAGSKAIAREFERKLKTALADYRTRGEWFVFAESDGAIFSRAAQAAYLYVTGRPLKWSEIPLDDFMVGPTETLKDYYGRLSSR